MVILCYITTVWLQHHFIFELHDRRNMDLHTKKMITDGTINVKIIQFLTDSQQLKRRKLKENNDILISC